MREIRPRAEKAQPAILARDGGKEFDVKGLVFGSDRTDHDGANYPAIHFDPPMRWIGPNRHRDARLGRVVNDFHPRVQRDNSRTICQQWIDIDFANFRVARNKITQPDERICY